MDLLVASPQRRSVSGYRRGFVLFARGALYRSRAGCCTGQWRDCLYVMISRITGHCSSFPVGCVSQTECRSEENSWLCVAQRMTNCYVPNRKKSTCKLVTEVGPYSESFRSCSCPGNEMPCTQEEVEVTEHEWKDSFTKAQALAVVGWQKSLWPDKTIKNDYGMAGVPGCAGDRYKAIFCRGTSRGLLSHGYVALCNHSMFER